MKKEHLLAFLVVAATFSLVACSGGITESENPVIVASFDDAKALMVRNSSDDASASVSKMVGKSSDINNYANYPILKLTSDNKILSAITDTKGETDNIPDVWNIKLSNNKYYVLFNGWVKVQNDVCSLVEVSSDNSLRCIDSKAIPCAAMSSQERLMPNKDAKKRVLVSLRSNGDIAYLTYGVNNLVANIAVLKTDGTRAKWDNSGIYFSAAIESSNGKLYGLGCESKYAGDVYFGHHSPYCLLNESSIVDLGGELSVDIDPETESDRQASVWPISGDRLVVDYRWASLLDSAPLRYGVGNLGNEITSVNFASSVTAETSLFSKLDDLSIFEIEDGSIYGATYGEINLVRADGLQRYSAPAKSFRLSEKDVFFIDIMDYIDGGQIAVGGVESDSGGGNSKGRVFLFEPSTEKVTSVTLPDGFYAYSMRFIDKNTLLFAGYQSLTTGSTVDSWINYYYKYTVDTGILTLLFQEKDSEQHFIIVP